MKLAYPANTTKLAALLIDSPSQGAPNQGQFFTGHLNQNRRLAIFDDLYEIAFAWCALLQAIAFCCR